METHTYDEWKDLGFYVCKGQRSSGRNDEGKALFRADQVSPIKPNPTCKEFWYADMEGELPADAPNQ